MPPTLLFAPPLPLVPGRAAARPRAATPRRLLPRASVTNRPAQRRAAVPPSSAAARRGAAPTPASEAGNGGASRARLFDALVIGAGPAGLALAAALSEQSLRVALVDPALHRAWPNHYGVWEDEFAAVGLADCASSRYPRTSIFAGPGDEKMLLDRAYIRVDRVMLKRRFVARCRDAGVAFYPAAVTAVDHPCDQWSVVGLRDAPPRPGADDRDAEEEEGLDAAEAELPAELRARLVVDCTGHAVAFTDVRGDGGAATAPWEQAAYGIEAEVEGYPFAKDEMVLMDFRDGHMEGRAADEAASEERPTFVYVFPEGEKRAFFEETSVIQPSAVDFDELRERLYRRLDHAGVRVTRVIEEERSLIPMGGALPDRGQRVAAFGGAAQLVHPATGYMVGRAVRMAERVAGRVRSALDAIGDDGAAIGAARAVWEETWGLRVRRQRDFLWFGAELLGRLGMDESRAFFQAFFRLRPELWRRFLAYELDSAPVRVLFALQFFVVAEPGIRVRLLRGIVEIGGWKLIRSTLPDWMSAWDED